MEKALIIGASGGIGGALTKALQARGAAVTGLSRSADGLDVTDEDSVKAALADLTGPYDLIVVASGALEIDGAEPEKTLKTLEPKAFLDQIALNALGPALVLKHAIRLVPRDQPAVFAALSARVGSIGDNRLGGWYSYRAAKTALNQLMHSAAIELARTHKQLCVACLHPGTVATPFTEKYLGRHPAVPPDQAAANLLQVIDGLTPAQTGRFYDWAGKAVPW
ncbi:SDR family NAD(P)-dependent oxidoreductase [Thalassococcus sp. CAU 1522]|uniref:SDR family NAD(P)-dependent oxidoreductase n=1 Tax=Thalassococcus arenae TaxID=2851652 RepID=A0ABS6N5M4_9RHOB|nr:SDR family NAD(P)-dependent oxidoreductase [Thalassococcus arenae]MBV2359309.1 SDR family NAD(P)-dependent oxidoreductase [Thalassococcus arenae]